MTPHYPDYYGQKKRNDGEIIGPTESQSPIPNTYLSVAPQGTEWNFVLLFAPEITYDEQKEFLKIFETQEVLEIGFGSKTSIGFGQFKVKDAQELLKESTEWVESEKKRLQKIEDDRKEQQRIAQENERIAQLSEVEQLIEKLKIDTHYKDSFNRIVDFKEDEQRKLAKFFKEKFQSDNDWDVKPKKEKQFNKVQKIKQILGD
ncbi:MAG: hypothetical protein HQM12_21290 [SAR324 cluster bacterium]|nr:hypothetical protein [SAR324 cluster bacterium]